MQTNWDTFKTFITGSSAVSTPAEQAAGPAEFTELHDALPADQAQVEKYVSDRVSAQIAAAEQRQSVSRQLQDLVSRFRYQCGDQ